MASGKRSKYHFRLGGVKLLAYIVSENGLKAGPDKVATIRDGSAQKDWRVEDYWVLQTSVE